jgi:hypothetical protein
VEKNGRQRGVQKMPTEIPTTIFHPGEPMTPEERADQMWRVHPRDLERVCMSRLQFYEAHIYAAIAQAEGKFDG